MKKSLLIMLMAVMMCGTGLCQNAMKLADEEAVDMTKSVVAEFAKYLDNPAINTGARRISVDEDGGMTFLCWVETIDGFWYVEVVVTGVNGNEKLSVKYGL